jgi:TonB family protein
VRAIVTTHSADVRACYDQALARRPSLAGTLSVEFVIGPKGDVTSATVTRSTLGDAAMEDCVVRKARGWRFPAPRGGGTVKVSYPFRFEAH